MQNETVCQDSFVQHFFMLNCHSCFRGNKTSVKYEFDTHDIEEYLNVNENVKYDGNEEDEFMIQYCDNNMF